MTCSGNEQTLILLRSSVIRITIFGLIHHETLSFDLIMCYIVKGYE